MRYKIVFPSFALLVALLLSACVVEEFTIHAVRFPAEALPRHAVASVEFDFSTVPERPGNSPGGYYNTHILAQLPADWLVVGAYMGYHDPDNGAGETQYWHLLPEAALPAGIEAESGAAALQLRAFVNIRRTSLLSSSNLQAHKGRLLFVPPSTFDAAAQEALQSLKILYGKIDEGGQFLPIWPQTDAEQGFAGVPALSASFVNQLSLSDADAPAQALPQSARFGLPEGLQEAMRYRPDTLYLQLPAQEDLSSRYAYRLFLSPDAQLGGTALPLRSDSTIYSYAQGDLAHLLIDYEQAQIGGRYYIDIPVTPGRPLGIMLSPPPISINPGEGRLLSNLIDGQRPFAWQYAVAVPLLSQNDAPAQLSAEPTQALHLPYSRISGRLSLPDGVSAPAGGVEFVIYFDQQGEVEGSLGHLRAVIPAGESGMDYEFFVANTFGGSQVDISVSAICTNGCDSFLAQTYQYSEWLNVSQATEYQTINIQFAEIPAVSEHLRLASVQSHWDIDDPVASRLIWRQGGSDETERGDKVVWGYYHADPALFDWADADNPEVFVKIWYDVSGRVDVNYCHVSVAPAHMQTFFDYETPVAYRTDVTLWSRYVGLSRFPDGHSYPLYGYEGAPPEPQTITPPGASEAVELRSELRMTPLEGEMILLQRQGGKAMTASKDGVAWGLYHADPAQVSWGSADNPEVFYKFWYAAEGRIDANFCFMSVPEITARTWMADTDTGAVLGEAVETPLNLSARYNRHEYRLE